MLSASFPGEGRGNFLTAIYSFSEAALEASFSSGGERGGGEDSAPAGGQGGGGRIQPLLGAGWEVMGFGIIQLLATPVYSIPAWCPAPTF